MTKLLEVAIGVATIMLLVSMSVTVITQFILSVLNQRGRHLVTGIGELIHQLDPSLEQKVASSISDTLLRHPLLRGNLDRPGDVIHRDELTALLMDLASGTGSFGQHPLQATAASILAKNGITDPAGTLDTVRNFSMQLEAESPELATHIRQSMAILRAAESKYVAKINAWFDQTIDRVSQRFTTSTRAITIVVGLVVAFGLQLDTIDLVNRLFINDDARAKLMDIASKVQQTASTNPGANPGKEAQAPAGAQGNGQSSSGTDINAYYSQLSNAGLITFPSGQSFTLGNILRRLPGVLLTALLLSLGAPFWYNTLSSLLKLRSPSAQKDDKQRSERQSSQTTDTGSSSTPLVQSPVTASVRFPIMPSEQGDLKAVG